MFKKLSSKPRGRGIKVWEIIGKCGTLKVKLADNLINFQRYLPMDYKVSIGQNGSEIHQFEIEWWNEKVQGK